MDLSISRPVEWYVAQLKPNGLSLAERNLNRQGYRTFCPRIRATRRRRDRFLTAQEPMFPGYLFVGLDPKQGAWRPIRSTLGVSRLVSFGEAPCAVPDALIECLRAHGTPSEGPAELSPGDTVRVLTGPFAEFVAQVEALAPDRRVWVLLDVLGRATRMTVPLGDVIVEGARR